MKLAVSKLAVSKLATGNSVSYSVGSLFSALLANQDALRTYLLDATPYDPALSSEVAVGYSHGLRHPVLAGRMFKIGLRTILNSEVNLFADDIGRGGSSSFGVIKILIGGEDADELTAYNWDGRLLRVLMGTQTFQFEQYEPVFVGTALDTEYDLLSLSLVIRDKSELLQVPIQTNTYTGAGGINGGSDLVGVPKPLGYGFIYNAKPILVDRVNLIYQVNDGSINSVQGVFDGASSYTFEANVADITATTVTPGYYKTQISGGYVRLGAEPAKTLTIDFEGDNSGSGYVSTAADIARRIVTGKTTLTDFDVNLQSIADTNTANSAVVGIYISNQGATVANSISELLESIGGSWVFDRVGVLQTGVFGFGSSVGDIYDKDIEAGSLRKVRTPIPTWRRKLGYAKCWTVQGQNDVVSGAPSSRKDFVGYEFRYSVEEDTAILTRHPLSPIKEIPTLLKTEAAAAAEATRQQAIFGADRNKYEVTVKRQQFKYTPGQTITVHYSRFGFPKSCLILGIIEDTEKRLTTLRLLA